MKRFKVAIPWLLAQLGVRKWVTERLVHIPGAVIDSACAEASKHAGVEVTPEQWRAVEMVQASLLYEGILVAADGL